MEEQLPSTSSSDERFADIAQSLAESRQRARDVLAAQRDDLEKLESGLNEHIRLIAQELAQDRSDLDTRQNDLRQQAVQLKQQEEKLRAGQEGWEQLEADARLQQEELAEFLQQKQDELDGRAQALRQEEARLQSVREETQQQQQALERNRQRLEQKELTLEETLDRADQQRLATKNQRRRIAAELKQQRSDLTRERREVEKLRKRDEEVQVQQTVELARLREECQAAREQSESLQQELATQRDAQESLRKDLEGLQTEKKTLEEQRATDQAERESLQVQHDALSKERDLLVGEIDQLRHSEDEDHVRQAAEMSHLREELQAAQEEYQQFQEDLAAQQSTVSQEQEQLATELQQARQELQTVNEASVSIEEFERVLNKCELALDDTRQLKQRNSELEEQLAQRPSADGVSDTELTTLRTERDALVERLAEAELKLSRVSADASSQQKTKDLQRRFEMAVEDVRELKMANGDLKEELAALKKSQKAATPAPSTGGNLDWEAQKNRLLASLEEDYDDDDDDDRQQRLTIEGTIHITDEIVADKEREIEELKRLLDDQSSSLGGVAVGAAAIAGMLDQDELICEERQRLASLQAQWKEKLSKAEIDLSVERARIARERTELDARIESLENEITQRVAGVIESGGGEAPVKSKGGRWLERLGLKDSQE